MALFAELGLSSEILSAISDMGFEVPTPIQEKTISHLLNSSNDLIATAQTGTGKTAAFGLPLIQKTDISLREVQAIVLCPTRELCIQIHKDFKKYTKYMKKIKITAVYGGANIDPQIDAIRNGTHILVGTPGRVIDLIKRKVLNLNTIKTLVLDEADEMLNLGFKEELNTILSFMPKERQTLLFSATMSNEITRIANNYMHNADEISTGHKNQGAENVEHTYYIVHASDKYLALKRIADMNPDIYALVFCRTRQETKDVAEKMMHDGYSADALHGDLSQAQRDQVMNRFRSRQLQMLVATDVAARGIDVDDITHVINYTIPDDNEVYLHRSGRTGRAGKSGKSISIINGRQKHSLQEMQNRIGKKFIQETVPSGKDICKRQLFCLIEKMKSIDLDDSDIHKYMDSIYEQLEGFSKEDIIKRFVYAEFSRFLNYYKYAPDIQSEGKSKRGDKETGRERSGSERGDRRDRREGSKEWDRDSRGSSDRRDSRDSRDSRGSRDSRDSRSSSESGERRQKKRPQVDEFTRLYINIGSKNKLSKIDLMDMINKQKELKGIEIGKIEIDKKFSIFDIDSKYTMKVVSLLNNVKYKGSTLHVEVAEA